MSAPSAVRKKERADLNETRYYHGYFRPCDRRPLPGGEVPAINEALTVEANGHRYTMEVEQHLEIRLSAAW